MKLIKINTDHYIIVDDSEIKEGDWTYHHVKGIYEARVDGAYTNQKKITHSTIPKGMMVIEGIKRLSLQEVKELIGEVDVEKKAKEYVGWWDEHDDQDVKLFTRAYYQALEDNKDKKYTEEDVIRIVEKSRETGLTAEYLIMTFQSKTEWEVEMVDGKLKLM
jgi:hypothetical protein